MRILGSMDMAEGTSVKNLTVARGDEYPSNPNAGELFYHNTHGLVIYDSTNTWHRIEDTRDEYNAECTFNIGSQVLTTELPYISRSTRLYLGGQRLCLGSDYVELSDTQLQLSTYVGEDQINSGSNFVIDFKVKVY